MEAFLQFLETPVMDTTMTAFLLVVLGMAVIFGIAAWRMELELRRRAKTIEKMKGPMK